LRNCSVISTRSVLPGFAAESAPRTTEGCIRQCEQDLFLVRVVFDVDKAVCDRPAVDTDIGPDHFDLAAIRSLSDECRLHFATHS
jgi:hypothetical protein